MELSFNRVHYFEYEKEMMLKHQKDYGHITYHWNNVPEDILFECGFIQNYHNHRMKYKNNYLGRLLLISMLILTVVYNKMLGIALVSLYIYLYKFISYHIISYHIIIVIIIVVFLK
mgnify:CR=1 FL=1